MSYVRVMIVSSFFLLGLFGPLMDVSKEDIHQAFLSYSSAHASSDRLCKRYFSKKQFERSADCFQRLVLSVNPKASEEDRLKAGVWLRNAVVALKRAARQEKKVGKAGYLREKGIKLLDGYIAKKLYANPSQKNLAETMKSGLVDSIGYSNLTVVSGHLKAKIQVIGYQFKVEGAGTLNQKLRPGTYTVLVTYPGKPASAKPIKIEASVPKVLTFEPPKKRVVAKRVIPRPRAIAPKPKGSPLPFVLIATGAAVAVAGGGLVGWSLAFTQADRDKLMSDGTPGVANTRQIASLTELAKTQNTAGWATSGVGLSVAVIGVVLLVAQPKPKKTSVSSGSLTWSFR